MEISPSTIGNSAESENREARTLRLGWPGLRCRALVPCVRALRDSVWVGGKHYFKD